MKFSAALKTMREAVDVREMAARFISRRFILIYGETGSGKGLLVNTVFPRDQPVSPGSRPAFGKVLQDARLRGRVWFDDPQGRWLIDAVCAWTTSISIRARIAYSQKEQVVINDIITIVTTIAPTPDLIRRADVLIHLEVARQRRKP